MEGGDQLGLEITELRLGLPGAVDGTSFARKNEKKRVFSDFTVERLGLKAYDDDRRAPVAKSQVVGWPPVCLYRKKNSLADRDRAEGSKNTCVKVSLDGAIYLRKIDLSVQKGYLELVLALEKLFGCHGIGEFQPMALDLAHFARLLCVSQLSSPPKCGHNAMPCHALKTGSQSPLKGRS